VRSRGTPQAGPAALRAGLLAAALLLSVARAGHAQEDDARAYHQKARAAFALTRYAEAAAFFEKAFELKPDPALLYDAAQAHRLAGNKERALALYQSYLRVYGRDALAASIDARIDELKKAIATDAARAPSATAPPPPETAPPPAALATATVAPPPAAPAAPPAVLITAAPPPAAAPAGGKTWIWIAAGGVLAVGAAIAVALLVSGGEKDPTPSVGRVNGN
jgi:hypothetical protein